MVLLSHLWKDSLGLNLPKLHPLHHLRPTPPSHLSRLPIELHSPVRVDPRRSRHDLNVPGCFLIFDGVGVGREEGEETGATEVRTVDEGHGFLGFVEEDVGLDGF